MTVARSREEYRETVESMLRLERLREQAGGVRAVQHEREQMSRARAMLRLRRIKDEARTLGELE